MTEKREVRSLLRLLFQTAVDAVMPDQLIKQIVQYDGHCLKIREKNYFFPSDRKIHIFGSGKASVAMLQACLDLCGERIAGGVVLCNTRSGLLGPVRVLESSHPIADEKTFNATEILIQAMSNLSEDDFFIYLLSGGSSAMVEKPLFPVTCEEYSILNTLMLQSGMPIEEMNAIRKHLSSVKGGRLAQMTAAKGVVLVLSDVIGDDLSVIGSGLLYYDFSTYEDVRRILDQYHLTSQLPPTVYAAIQMGLTQQLPETPKLLRKDIEHIIIGNNALAVTAAYKKAVSMGFRAEISTNSLCGEARETARSIANHVRKLDTEDHSHLRPICLIFGGETTVTVRGNGKGGRNQEFCLSALSELREWPHYTLLSAGTDGIDGNTDAAGAMVDASSYRRAKELGLDIHDFLNRNDSYTFFKQTGDLFFTGLIGTNVGDIVLVWMG